MASGDAQTVRKLGDRFRYVVPLVNFDPLVKADMNDSVDAQEKKARSEIYFELTGEDIEQVERRMND
jgi:hypothetical protein